MTFADYLATLTPEQRLAVADASPGMFAAAYSEGAWELRPHLAEIDAAIIDGLSGVGPSMIIVNVPPQHGKSLLVSRWTPAWLLHRWPDRWVILGSYNSEYAAEWGESVRDLMVTLRERGVTQTALSRTQRASWTTTMGGGMHTAGTQAGITGRKAHVLIVDDPYRDGLDADSQARRDDVWTWFVTAARTRLQPGGIVLLIHTRWHEDDLTGRLLTRYAEIGMSDRVRHIVFRAVAEEDERIAGVLRPKGSALWPARYSRAYLEETRLISGEYQWNAVYQQRPTSPEGAVWLRDFWDGRNRFDLLRRPTPWARVTSWDTSISEKDASAYTVGITAEILPPPDLRLQIVDVYRKRLNSAKVPGVIDKHARYWNRDGKLRYVVIEDKASGTSSLQVLQAASQPWLARKLRAFDPSGDKVFRSRKAAVWAENDSILLPIAAPWLADLLRELADFPTGKYNDQADALAQLVLFCLPVLERSVRNRMASIYGIEGTEGGYGGEWDQVA